jgi:phosphatidylinositol-3-phosphatase
VRAVAAGRAWPTFACSLVAAAGALLLQGCATSNAPYRAPPVGHVFIIVLENEEFEESFGERSPAQYLKGLPSQGALLPNYYATSHASLGNYLALISGQAPNIVTNNDCEVFEDFVGSAMTADGQAIGHGCVYPASVRTLANQLDDKGLRWKAYMEDMGNNPKRESATCGHPPIGAADNTQQAEPGDQYAARHNPFVYFHGIIHTPGCSRNVVNLTALAADLKSIETTPNYVFISPNLCHDGHDGGNGGHCVDGEPGGMVSADRFLAELVPQILAAPAFKHDGLLIVTFDESEIEERPDPSTGGVKIEGDATHCCNEQPGPNIPAYEEGVTGTWERMNGPGIIGPGGGRIGAVLLSPYIRPGTVSREPYNHYALLRSVEDIFGLGHLGYAGQEGLRGFGPDVYTQPAGHGN